jgi:hypothetical protein
VPGVRWFVLALLTACTSVVPRFPTDVQTSLAHDDMRRLETARFIIYYPAARRDEVDRFLVRADAITSAPRGLCSVIVISPSTETCARVGSTSPIP